MGLGGLGVGLGLGLGRLGVGSGLGSARLNLTMSNPNYERAGPVMGSSDLNSDPSPSGDPNYNRLEPMMGSILRWH